MAEYTPMMRQYLKTKEDYPDCIIFYRLGDFYEMFFDDAITVSRELEIALTGKNCGMEERAPMCGVPFHAVDAYLPRLVEKGYKVAICEQVSDPKESKGLVKREVTRIVTPGTNMDSASNTSDNIFICSIVCVGDTFGYSICDVSTGEFLLEEFDGIVKLEEEIRIRSPKEIIMNTSFEIAGGSLMEYFKNSHIATTLIDEMLSDEESSYETLKNHFKDGIDECKPYSVGMISAACLINYLTKTQMNELTHINCIRVLKNENYMGIDSFSFRNLELVETLREKEKRGSLIWVLDKTKTAMGARMLYSFLKSPLIKRKEIENRLDAVEELKNNMLLSEELREYMNGVYDLERLITRIAYKTANPRDIIAFKDSLKLLPPIKMLLSGTNSDMLKAFNDRFDTLDEVCKLLEDAISDEAPINVYDGHVIKTGFNEEIDKLRVAQSEGKNWLAALEEEERAATGIKNMKIKYNKVFGYYLEVTKSNLDMVPDYYIRKQTLANCERYYTPKLKEMEEDILGAEDKLSRLEVELFRSILDKLSNEIERVQNTANIIAAIDALSSLAVVASKNHYVRPSLNEEGKISIKGGRHPVVEKMINQGEFIANDVSMNNEDDRLLIITGPNMAGKSTYMRQTALIVLMAQIGSFVPCDEANIGIVDRIFTRVGASDDLASGQSTFMVEMHEMANILKNANENSLIILDEIGRGTSTYDGLSIAWAIAEYINDKSGIGAKTMFATHYHEMTKLANTLPGIKNYSIAVIEKGDDIIFLRKIIPGGADKSYGIQVAKLAGVPDEVIGRAKQILDELVDGKQNENSIESKKQDINDNQKQLSFFDPTSMLIEELKGIDISELSPRNALNYLYDIQDRIKKL